VRSRVETLTARARATEGKAGAGGAAAGGAAAGGAGAGDDGAGAAHGAPLPGGPELRVPAGAAQAGPGEGVSGGPPGPEPASADDKTVAGYNRPAPSSRATPIGRLPKRGRATVEGRVHSVEIRPVEQNTVLACEVIDSTGDLTAMFYGRSHIPGLDPGAKVRLTGHVGARGKEIVMVNPAYELLAPGSGDPAAP